MVDGFTPETAIEALPVRALVGFLSLRPKGATASVGYLAERLGCSVAAVEQGLTANYALGEITSSRTEATAVRFCRPLEDGERYVIVPMALVGALKFQHLLLWCLIKRRRVQRKDTSDAALAAVTGWSRRRVLALRNELESAGWLAVLRTPGQAHVYTPNMRPMQALPAKGGCANTEGSTHANTEGSLLVVTSPSERWTREAFDEGGKIPSVENLRCVEPGTDGHQSPAVIEEQPAAAAAVERRQQQHQVPAPVEPLRMTEGVRFLVELGKVCPELRFTGSVLRDQARNVDGLLSLGWKRDEIRQELLRPYPADIRTSVAAIVSRRLRDAAATPPPSSVMAPTLPGHGWGEQFKLERETYTAPRFEDLAAADFTPRRWAECPEPIAPGIPCGAIAGSTGRCDAHAYPDRVERVQAMQVHQDAMTPAEFGYPAPYVVFSRSESESLIDLDATEWNR